MTTKPATPLPWNWMSNDTEGRAGILVVQPDGTFDEVAQNATREDAAYIVAACNAYPELVAALKVMEAMQGWLAERCSATDKLIHERATQEGDKLRALLAKLGEGA